MLVHAKHRWPKAINAHLWPYALHVANQVHMHLPTRNGQGQLDLFSQISSTLTPKYFHPFGCPVYVLTKPDEKGSKWEKQSWIGINLGNSPTHAGSISLVLNIETGLVSPQFHVKFNDPFNTVLAQQLQIRWQQRTRFTKSDKPAPTEPPVPDMYLLPLQETRQTGCQVVLNSTLPNDCCYQQVAYSAN
jgi:hypothetical protein